MGAANKHIVLRLIPETDTALHTDQAGELAYTPIMLLRYAEHLEALLGLHGIVNVSVAAIGSCVSANGFAPQSLFQPTANLLEHLPGYTSLRAELTGHSGIGTFLYPWRAAGPSEGSQSSYSQSVELCDVRAPPEGQHRSDQAYRWLYSPLYSRRHKADWPFRRGGWSRLPTISDATAPWPPADVAPEWARRCSFCTPPAPRVASGARSTRTDDEALCDQLTAYIIFCKAYIDLPLHGSHRGAWQIQVLATYSIIIRASHGCTWGHGRYFVGCISELGAPPPRGRVLVACRMSRFFCCVLAMQSD